MDDESPHELLLYILQYLYAKQVKMICRNIYVNFAFWCVSSFLDLNDCKGFFLRFCKNNSLMSLVFTLIRYIDGEKPWRMADKNLSMEKRETWRWVSCNINFAITRGSIIRLKAPISSNKMLFCISIFWNRDMVTDFFL